MTLFTKEKFLDLSDDQKIAYYKENEEDLYEVVEEGCSEDSGMIYLDASFVRGNKIKPNLTDFDKVEIFDCEDYLLEDCVESISKGRWQELTNELGTGSDAFKIKVIDILYQNWDVWPDLFADYIVDTKLNKEQEKMHALAKVNNIYDDFSYLIEESINEAEED